MWQRHILLLWLWILVGLRKGIGCLKLKRLILFPTYIAHTVWLVILVIRIMFLVLVYPVPENSARITVVMTYPGFRPQVSSKCQGGIQCFDGILPTHTHKPGRMQHCVHLVLDRRPP